MSWLLGAMQDDTIFIITLAVVLVVGIRLKVILAGLKDHQVLVQAPMNLVVVEAVLVSS